MFFLLISGVILSPMGVYAMDDEGGAPTSSISRAAPSTQPDVEKVAPPFSIPGMKISDGERLQKIGDDWINEAGTIRLPAPKRNGLPPMANYSGKEEFLGALTDRGAHATEKHRLVEGDITKQYPNNPVWAGEHHLFIMNYSGGIPAINVFPIIRER